MKDSGISTSQTSLILLKSNKTLTCAKEKSFFFSQLIRFQMVLLLDLASYYR